MMRVDVSDSKPPTTCSIKTAHGQVAEGKKIGRAIPRRKRKGLSPPLKKPERRKVHRQDTGGAGKIDDLHDAEDQGQAGSQHGIGKTHPPFPY